MSGKEVHFNITSMVSSRTREPLVVIKLQDIAAQIPPDEARRIGHWILEAAEAAEQDAFFCGFMEKRLGVSQEQAAVMLHWFREERGMDK